VSGQGRPRGYTGAMLPRVAFALIVWASAAGAEDVFNKKVAVLAPFPREVPRNKQLILSGTVKGAFRGPKLLIIAPNGRTYKNDDNDIGEYRFTHTVTFEDGPGRYRMEIVAKKTKSTKSAARFSVWYARRKPVHDPDPPPPEGANTPVELHPRLVEKQLLKMFNDLRTTMRLKPFGWNEAVSARCREHGLRMARARRRVHRFGAKGGVYDMLRRDGAGPGNHSGPTVGWPRVGPKSPLPRPAPQPPGPRVRNHVTAFVIEVDSLERMFEKLFVREAAYRICAVDPNCVEVGIGAARTPVKATTGTRRPRQDPKLYCTVCFVQVNDKTLIDGQDAAYKEILRRAGKREPFFLRHLGVWGRGGRAESLLSKTARHEDPKVAAAAFDGWLLLDEESARKSFGKVATRADAAYERSQWTAAALPWLAYTFVFYDARIRRTALDRYAAAERAARTEFASARALQEPERKKALSNLLRRCRGLRVEPEIKAALEP